MPTRAAARLRSAGSPRGRVRDISFDLLPGEVLGLAGLVGAGRTEVVRMLFGADPRESGTIEIDGEPVHIRSPRDAIRHGLALLPEDRRNQGGVAAALGRGQRDVAEPAALLARAHASCDRKPSVVPSRSA